MAEPAHAEAKKRYGRLFSEVRSILNEEDPIGLIAIGCPDDEYEPEVGTILPRLREATSIDDVRIVIDTEFTRWFGVETVGSWRASTELAEKVWTAWHSFRDTSNQPPAKLLNPLRVPLARSKGSRVLGLIGLAFVAFMALIMLMLPSRLGAPVALYSAYQSQRGSAWGLLGWRGQSAEAFSTAVLGWKSLVMR